MTKGSIVVSAKPARKWVTVFDEWFRSPYIALVIHCIDYQQCRNVQKSAAGYRYRTNKHFWTHTDGTDIYLIRPEAIKKYAVETKVDSDGLIRFLVQESLESERYLYNKGMID